MNEVAWRILLLIVAGVVAYRVFSKRRKPRSAGGGGPYWKEIVQLELDALKKTVPVEHYVNLMALSRSDLSHQECLAQLDEIVIAMRAKDVDPEPILDLMQKIRNTVRN